MGQTGTKAGHESTNLVGHWPEIQRLAREGKTVREITAWLIAQGVQTSKSSVARALERIRETLTEDLRPPPPPVPELQPLDDEDELALMRRLARHEMVHGTDWKQRHSALRALIAVRVEKRASKDPDPAGDQPGASAATSSPATSPVVRAPTFN